jgi:hypothetical protein
MKTAPLLVAVVIASVPPIVFSSFGCNKKEDAPPPAPSGTTAIAATTAPTAAPAPTPLLPVQPSSVAAKATVAVPRGDAAPPAAAKADAAVVGVRTDAAAAPTIAIPPGLPTIALPHPSAIPGIASSVVDGIMKQLPPPIIPPPNPTQ